MNAARAALDASSAANAIGRADAGAASARSQGRGQILMKLDVEGEWTVLPT